MSLHLNCRISPLILSNWFDPSVWKRGQLSKGPKRHFIFWRKTQYAKQKSLSHSEIYLFTCLLPHFMSRCQDSPFQFLNLKREKSDCHSSKSKSTFQSRNKFDFCIKASMNADADTTFCRHKSEKVFSFKIQSNMER
jgi:hypothetical protein